MLGWLLAGCPPTDLPTGVYALPRWMNLHDARRLGEAIAEVQAARLPVLELPLARLLAADPAQRAQTRGVILIERPATPLSPKLLPHAVVLVVGGAGAPSSLRELRDGLRLSLSRALANETHPLRLLGAGPWLVHPLTQRATEPLDLLDLFDGAVEHRRRYAEQDEDAWERSVAHAAGALVAQRLLRLPVETRWDALRALLALPAAGAGVVAAERLGLIHVEASGPRALSLARGLTDGETRGGLLAGIEGETLPEDLRAALVPAPAEPSVSIVSSPTPSAAGGALVADAARAWIDGLSGLRDPALLSHGLAALALANKAAHYSDDARLSALGPVVLALRSAARGSGSGARAAEALAELIMLTASWLPADEESQVGALEALRRLWSQGVIPQEVWALALLRRAERLLNAPKAVDTRGMAEGVLQEAEGLVGDGAAQGQHLYLHGRLCHERGQHEEALAWFSRAGEVYARLSDHERKTHLWNNQARALTSEGKFREALALRAQKELPLWLTRGDEHRVASTRFKIAELKAALGELDDAKTLWASEVLPVYERLRDARGVALTQSRLADLCVVRGQIDEALRTWRTEVLPVLERLGDALMVATTQGKIADMLQLQGQHDEALRLRREEVLPVFERLGDEPEVAATMTKIADVLEQRGQLDEALRIHRDEVFPIFERLGFPRDALVTTVNIAANLLRRDEPEHRARGNTILTAALEQAKLLNLPVEADHIRWVFAANNLPIPAYSGARPA